MSIKNTKTVPVMVNGNEIFVGEWRPKMDGESLGVFNLFAGAKDFGGMLTYLEMLKKLASLENGDKSKNEDELYKSIDDGTYKGGLFPLTRDMVLSNDGLGEGEVTMPNGSVYDLIEEGELKGTFNTCADPNNHNNMYWLLDKTIDPDMAHCVKLSEENGGICVLPSDQHLQLTRLVRAEPKF